MRKYLPYISIIGAMLIWSVSGIAIKYALVSFSSLTMIVMRFTMAVALLLLIGLSCKGNHLLGLQRLDRKDLPLFALAAFFQPCLYYLLETYTYDALSSPTVAEALLSMSPVLSPVFALVLLREQVTRYNILGILVSTVGMLMLIFVGSSDFTIGQPMGIVAAFASVSTAILYSVVLRRIPQKYNALSIVFYIQGMSLLFFYPMWGLVDGVSWPFPADIASVGREWWLSFAGIIYLAVFSSVTAFILFCYTVRCIGVTRTNAFNNVRPAFTALAMLIFFGEHLPIVKILGIILIIAGLFVCQKQTKSEKS